MTLSSALYRGAVTHRRLRPKVHKLRYRVFWLLLDLSELDLLDRRFTLFSRNRFNLLSFHDRDHGDRSGAPLRPQVEALLNRAGVDLEGGPIRLLTMPRVLGYVFNPISVYYCSYPDGRLAATIYEVTSTFGVRHSYVIPVSAADAGAGLVRQRAAKALHVSPFLDMRMDYVFRGRAPGEGLELVVDGLDEQGLLITAGLSAKRRDLTDATVLSATLAMPLSTFKVVAAIHWEALLLWFKGVALTRAPSPAGEPVSVQRAPFDSCLKSSPDLPPPPRPHQRSEPK